MPNAHTMLGLIWWSCKSLKNTAWGSDYILRLISTTSACMTVSMYGGIHNSIWLKDALMWLRAKSLCGTHEKKPRNVFIGLTCVHRPCCSSVSDMDDRHYHIEWFPQVCIDSGDNLPMSSAVTATAAATASSSASSPDFASDGMGKILKATVSVSDSATICTLQMLRAWQRVNTHT